LPDVHFSTVKQIAGFCFNIKFKGFGRAPAGRAFRCKSSLRCGLSAAIPHARPFPRRQHQFLRHKRSIVKKRKWVNSQINITLRQFFKAQSFKQNQYEP